MPDQTLTNLYPPFAEQITPFLEQAKSINAFLFEGFRSFDTQLEYYKKGRTYDSKKKAWVVIDKKTVITNGQPGYSFHQYGIAIDLAFDDNLQKQGIQWSWNSKLPWIQLGDIGKKYGLIWGGRWLNFPDLPHFESSYGLSIQQCYNLFINGGLKAVWKEFDKSIKNNSKFC